MALEPTLPSKDKSGEHTNRDNIRILETVAVPEPGGIVTMGIGLRGHAIGARCRRRRNVA